ncbi:MAG: preprotein translocase subunit SecG [Alphaproteobacteria bacterium]|nr:preprotein translocase subunit SecG [Alphaproteobacteria bacterium]
MINTLFVINIIIVLLMIAIILVQKSEGGVLGMGGGSRNALFSASSAGNLITKLTWFLGGSFFVICIILALLVARKHGVEADFIANMESRSVQSRQAAAAEKAQESLPKAPTE